MKQESPEQDRTEQSIFPEANRALTHNGSDGIRIEGNDDLDARCKAHFLPLLKAFVILIVGVSFAASFHVPLSEVFGNAVLTFFMLGFVGIMFYAVISQRYFSFSAIQSNDRSLRFLARPNRYLRERLFTDLSFENLALVTVSNGTIFSFIRRDGTVLRATLPHVRELDVQQAILLFHRYCQEHLHLSLPLRLPIHLTGFLGYPDSQEPMEDREGSGPQNAGFFSSIRNIGISELFATIVGILIFGIVVFSNLVFNRSISYLPLLVLVTLILFANAGSRSMADFTRYQHLMPDQRATEDKRLHFSKTIIIARPDLFLEVFPLLSWGSVGNYVDSRPAHKQPKEAQKVLRIVNRYWDEYEYFDMRLFDGVGKQDG